MIGIALGANLDSALGTPEQALKKCPELLKKYDINVTAFSSIWKSAPIPISDQPWYHNAVCLIETKLKPQNLLQTLASIETKAGRVRNIKNEPRVLDLDILFYHDEVMDNGLTLPHPRMHERAFVLYPLQEVAPNWMHPVLNKTVSEMIEDLPEQQIEKINCHARKGGHPGNKSVQRSCTTFLDPRSLNASDDAPRG